MSDYMEYAEFYKKAWERSLSERTTDMQKELDLLRAEVEGYRAALEIIKDWCDRATHRATEALEDK